MSKKTEKDDRRYERYKQSQRSYKKINSIEMIGQRQLQDKKKRTLKSLCFEETRYLGEENRVFEAGVFEKIHREGMKQ